ncbi:alpha/beta hydrolase [Enterococcus sp. BWB1-3]|uniref:alpha/beta fold hydrolase n=1 Tax=unclassified Enterococcus TaxID=2608891 RepID=UPI001922C238|nr:MULTISPECIES: alpha/beta hydrolase [unclassified Enterococcus]MBL1230638.1 alpha/beta hydrolase [Enterococcus sp. BWB1-3]MCB5952215.1 alpha/beta hydrolase [Enterococcus sp. BWT-B8]
MESTYILSSDKQTRLHLVYWEPQQSPVGIVQIIHGMAEYIERYSDFAAELNRLGYVVVGHDHLGHGKSVDEVNPKYGYFGKGETAKTVIEDIHLVKQWTELYFPEISYFMLGHSMGSFALRNYLQQNQKERLNGAILMGTGTGAAVIPAILALTSVLNRLQPEKVNYLLDHLAFGSFSKNFPEESQFNWLSKNQENVKSYEKGALTGFIFTNNGFHTLFQLLHNANRKGWADNISKTLPILVISGEQDPVGDFGNGVRKVAKDLNAAGVTDVTMAMFAELRHELLLEKEKAQVYEKISSWIKAHNK